MKFLCKIRIKALLYTRMMGQWWLKFLIKNKTIVLWICVPTVLMIMWEVGKWIFEKLKQKKSCGKQF